LFSILSFCFTSKLTSPPVSTITSTSIPTQSSPDKTETESLPSASSPKLDSQTNTHIDHENKNKSSNKQLQQQQQVEDDIEDSSDPIADNYLMASLDSLIKIEELKPQRDKFNQMLDDFLLTIAPFATTQSHQNSILQLFQSTRQAFADDILRLLFRDASQEKKKSSEAIDCWFLSSTEQSPIVSTSPSPQLTSSQPSYNHVIPDIDLKYSSVSTADKNNNRTPESNVISEHELDDDDADECESGYSVINLSLPLEQNKECC